MEASTEEGKGFDANAFGRKLAEKLGEKHKGSHIEVRMAQLPFEVVYFISVDGLSDTYYVDPMCGTFIRQWNGVL